MPGIDPISNIATAASKIISLFKLDPTIKAQLEAQASTQEFQAEAQSVLGQLDINKTEAASASTFVAAWRPLVGYVCASGLGIQFVVNPLFTWAASLFGHPVQFPSLDMGTLMTLLVGMLGLGGLRTFEKLNGVQGNH